MEHCPGSMASILTTISIQQHKTSCDKMFDEGAVGGIRRGGSCGLYLIPYVLHAIPRRWKHDQKSVTQERMLLRASNTTTRLFQCMSLRNRQILNQPPRPSFGGATVVWKSLAIQYKQSRRSPSRARTACARCPPTNPVHAVLDPDNELACSATELWQNGM